MIYSRSLWARLCLSTSYSSSYLTSFDFHLLFISFFLLYYNTTSFLKRTSIPCIDHSNFFQVNLLPTSTRRSATTCTMASSSFDPFTQNVTFHYMDGTPFNVSIIELNSFVQYDTKISINYGSQIGASLVLLIILALMTKPERRKAPVCILNASALMFNVARLICMCIYFTSPFSELYSFFAGDYSRVPSSAYATSIMGVILTFFLLVCLEASLVLQVRVICSTARPLYRHLVLAASLVVAVVALGFRAAFVVQNSKFIAAAEDFSPFVWLQSVTNIAITVSVCFFSGVFIIKLGYAIRQRRQLGFKKFGPMQVIFIMGCQTMVVPGK